ncbi:MAG: hypothetical protein WBA00_10265 [Rhodococcus sp. (in: high G+C Gram-positive bacteria)]
MGKMTVEGALAEPVTRREQHRVLVEELRALGFRVVRWTWDDLAHPDALLGRLRAALG